MSKIHELAFDAEEIDRLLGSIDIKSITYGELKTLRDNSQLNAGQWYRITDYVTTTSQEDTRSAGHQFDILVHADTEDTLNENAYACCHEGDEYFADSDLAGWQLSYSLDNNTARFAWAVTDSVDAADVTVLACPIDALPTEAKSEAEAAASWGFYKSGTTDDGVIFGFSVDEGVTISDELTVTIPSDAVVREGYAISVDGTETIVISVNGNAFGKGVIYYMKDEWGNEAPFDFKNMLFTRDIDWFGDHETWAEDVLGEVPATDLNFYFLSWVTEDGEVQDASIVGQTLANDEGAYSGVYNNVIKETTAYSMGITEDATSTAFALPCTIIVNSYAYEEGFFYGCYGNTFGNNCSSNTFGNYCQNNTFGNDCYSNTFGNNCYSNTFGNNCSSNTFGNNCYSNTFGNYCQNNTFGNNCYSNTFGNDCYSNTFGNNCSSNTFGNNCSSNTFGNNCYSNTFGNYCQNNTFGNNCHSNTFGNDCYSNTFGNDCYNNTFGNNCSSNTFGNNCHSNTFGNDCYSNTFGSYCRQITVFEGVANCSITGGSNGNSYVQNAQILNGTRGNSNNNKLTVTFAIKKTYTQVAGLRTNGTLRIYNPMDEQP